MKNKMITFLLLFVVAQVLIWFQTYGQFKWPWFAENTWFLVITGLPITYIWIIGTRIGMDVFDGKSWALRFTGFSTGIIVFAILSRIVLGEAMTIKALVSLILSCVIIIIQFL